MEVQKWDIEFKLEKTKQKIELIILKLTAFKKMLICKNLKIVIKKIILVKKFLICAQKQNNLNIVLTLYNSSLKLYLGNYIKISIKLQAILDKIKL